MYVLQLKNSESESSSGPSTTLHETPIRIITGGQEVTTDCDEKTLAEAGFKDNQVRKSERETILSLYHLFATVSVQLI